LQAQTSSSITISSNPVGARFLVDGQLYFGTQTLNWPTGSKHTVTFVTDAPLPGQGNNSTVQTSIDGGTMFVLNGWIDNQKVLVPSLDPTQIVTANPAVTSLTATVTVSYRVMLNFFNAPLPSSPPACLAPGAIPPGVFRPGVVYINSACFWSSTTVFVQANLTVFLNAYPYPGFVFTGWAINGAAPSQFLTNLTVTGPTVIAPFFEAGKRVHFLSSPPGLKLLIDHTTVPTRSSSDPNNCPNNETQGVAVQLGFPPLCFGDFDFVGGSTHFITGVTPQLDQYGKWWVFSSWSNGQGPDALYTIDSNLTSSAAMTGIFVPGAQVVFLTQPGGLQLSVDGRQNWGSYAFMWGLGTTHQVSAPATAVDAKGRKYTYQNWSNGGSASQTIVVNQNTVTNGMRLTANYSVLSRVVVQTVPSGQTVQVDGASCQAPCNVDRQSGAQIHVTVPTQIPMGQGARLDFASWSDGGASDHIVTVNQDYTVLTASYGTSYQLNATSNPGNGAAFQFSPSSSDMFYAQNTLVSVTANPNSGFKFRRWTGDLTGTFPQGVVDMTLPRNVAAQMDAIPYIAPAGILNGVGQTPSSAVAPGSLISIFGQSLAGTVQSGPVNPLSQSIAGVSVTVNNMILPLLFVSPQQINAQLPSGLANGNYTLQVHNTGQPDITGNFTVARNAPGLFFQTVNSQQIALAFHADGSLVTTGKPAAGGEVVSLLGTGFGPYSGTVLDGFHPPNPPPALADSVTLSVGGHPVVPKSAGAAPGYTGVTLTQFQVPAGLPGGTMATVKATINGIDSNTVMLPLQ
jgi:uncharacterized protein (TIGR03437 family)